MLKRISSPLAVSALLLLAGATAVPTAIALENNEFMQWGVGIFTLGAVFIAFLLLLRIWRWEQFARIRAIGRGYMFLLMNAATVALFPAAVLHLRIIGQMYPERICTQRCAWFSPCGRVELRAFRPHCHKRSVPHCTATHHPARTNGRALQAPFKGD